MNREIKFRVWDIGEKKMKYHKDLDGADGMFISFRGDVYSIDFYCPDGGIGEANVKLMQYTGLKDKNGKEIYESDIIKEPFGVGEIVFWKGAFGLDYGNRKTPLCINDLSNFEVIGNVYEDKKII